MLIPLGILATAGAGGGPPAVPAMELISTINGTGALSTLSFSSIPQTYKHLQIRYVAQETSTSQFTTIRFNGNTSTIYAYHRLSGNGSTVTSGADPGNNAIVPREFVARNTTTNAHSAGIIDLLDYSSTSKNTTMRMLYGNSDTTSIVVLGSGGWFNTSAITSIDFFVNANWNSSTRFSLYGIKG